MRGFALLAFVLSLISHSALAKVNELKTDVYFANGINTTNRQAWDSIREMLEPNIQTEVYVNSEVEMDKHIGKFDLAYNESRGFGLDFLEAALQKVSTGRVVPDKSSILL